MNVSADWGGNTNNNVEIQLNKDLNIVGWQITTSENVPTEFISVDTNSNTSSENENNTQNITSNTLFNLPNNVVINSNITSSQTNTTSQVNQEIQQPRTEPIVIHTSLDIDKVYYLWIKDSYGNTSYQTFSIHKAVI